MVVGWLSFVDSWSFEVRWCLMFIGRLMLLFIKSMVVNDYSLNEGLWCLMVVGKRRWLLIACWRLMFDCWMVVAGC